MQYLYKNELKNIKKLKKSELKKQKQKANPYEPSKPRLISQTHNLLNLKLGFN